MHDSSRAHSFDSKKVRDSQSEISAYRIRFEFHFGDIAYAHATDITYPLAVIVLQLHVWYMYVFGLVELATSSHHRVREDANDITACVQPQKPRPATFRQRQAGCWTRSRSRTQSLRVFVLPG